MALTITFQHQNYIPKGPSIRVASGVPAASDYATGGYLVGIAALQFGTDVSLLVPSMSGGYVVGWDKANDKVIVYYADYDAVGDGALIEVPATTDLSGEVLYFFAVGY